MDAESHRLLHRVSGPITTPLRLDVYITTELKLFPRSQLKQRLQRLLVNGKEVKPGKKVKEGDEVEIFYTDPPPLDLLPEAMALDIIYEDEDVIVIDKPQGLVVHPGAGNPSHTLVNGLLAYCTSLKSAFGENPLRPGIVHRLDKDTSGVIITAKHPAALEFLARQFRGRTVKKLYLAFVSGRLPEREGKLETAIVRDRAHRKRFTAQKISGEYARGAKRALTRYRVLREWPEASLVLLKPATGRTHQLRVHMKYLGCPIIGDPVYGRGEKFGSEGLMLHAYKLALRLRGDQEPRVFIAPLPMRFRKMLKRIGRADISH